MMHELPFSSADVNHASHGVLFVTVSRCKLYHHFETNYSETEEKEMEYFECTPWDDQIKTISSSLTTDKC